MSKFEPKIEHFFLMLSSDNVTENLISSKENIEEFIYYTSSQQINSVINSFLESGNKGKIFKGLVSCLPLSYELVKKIFSECIKNLMDEDVAEAYKWLNDTGTILVNNLKAVSNYVEKNKIIEPYKVKVSNAEEKLESLKKQFDELEEYNKKYDSVYKEIETMESKIDILKKEQTKEYWNLKKQELKEKEIELLTAKEEYQKDCMRLIDIEKDLSGYQSGAVNKNIDKYLKTLHSIAEQLPNDEVN